MLQHQAFNQKEKTVTQSCKNICKRYKKGMTPAIGSMYLAGFARCNICQVFIKWEGLWCPCCGVHLSKKPRYKKSYNKNVKVKRY